MHRHNIVLNLARLIIADCDEELNRVHSDEAEAEVETIECVKFKATKIITAIDASYDIRPKCPKCNTEIGFLFEYEKAEVRYTYTVDRDWRPHSRQHDVLTGALIGYDCPECGKRLFDQEVDAIKFLAGDISLKGAKHE